MFNVVHKNVRGGSNYKYPVGVFQKKNNIERFS